MKTNLVMTAILFAASTTVAAQAAEPGEGATAAQPPPATAPQVPGTSSTSPQPPPPSTATPPEKQCEPCDDRDATEGVGAFMLGLGLFDFSSLNDRLQANGYEKLSNMPTLIGGEGHAVFQSGFVAGARGAGILTPSISGPAGVEATFGGGFGMVEFGYAFVHTAPFLFTATAGIGGYGIGLDIGDTQPAAFDDVLKTPRRSASLSRGGLLVGLTLGFDARVPIGHVERGRRGFFTVGARVGALLGPALGEWGLEQGTHATAAPSTGLNGGYAALAIGFGGGRTRSSD